MEEEDFLSLYGEEEENPLETLSPITEQYDENDSLFGDDDSILGEDSNNVYPPPQTQPQRIQQTNNPNNQPFQNHQQMQPQRNTVLPFPNNQNNNNVNANMGLNGPQIPKIISYSVQGDFFHVTNRYSLKYVIGNGAYGTVCSGYDEVSKQKCAIKKVHNVFRQNYEYQKRIFREMKILQHFNHHENIIHLIDLIPPTSFNQFKDVYFCFELMDTDLRQIINSNQSLSEDHIQFFLYQILKAVKYIHSASVLHRDLKPENVLINSDCDLKICDFGLARGVDFEMSNPVMSTPYVATRFYRAPELMCMWEGSHKAIDVWSIGCIFAELLNRKPLFPGKNYLHQIQLIINVLGTPPPQEIRGCMKAKEYISKLPKRNPMKFSNIFPKQNPMGLDLLEKMLRFDPFKRISVEQALEHPYLKNFHDVDDEPTSKPFDFQYEKLLENKNTDMKKMIFKEIVQWNLRENNLLIQ